MQYININGKITPSTEAALPVDNGAFRYGYGLFETMLVQDGDICNAVYHWDRLFAGMKQLHFELPRLLTAQVLQNDVLHTVSKNKASDLCRVRLQVYAGGGGLYSNESRQPYFVIECFPLGEDNSKLNENGLTIGIATGTAKSPDTLANLKSCNALIYAIAARQAKAQQWNDALICNTNGHLIESTIANLFWVKDGTIYTPPLADGCIAGVMRRHIMTITPVTEKSCTADDLLHADELFLTNAIKRIRWVAAMGDKRYTNATSSAFFSRL